MEVAKKKIKMATTLNFKAIIIWASRQFPVGRKLAVHDAELLQSLEKNCH